MAEQSPSQVISDWVAAAESATKQNAQTVAQKIAGYYTNDAVLCATPEGIITEQSNILQDYAQNFGFGWVLKGITPNQPPIHQITNDWAWAVGEWNGSAPSNPSDPNSPVVPLTGYWSILFANQPTSKNPTNWLIQEHTIVTNLPSS